MSNFKSLVSGVGNLSKTTKYYDDWSENYDATLKLWNYQGPKTVSYTHLTLPTTEAV